MIRNQNLFAAMTVVFLGSGAAYILACSTDSRSKEAAAEEAPRRLEAELALVELKVKAPSEVKFGEPLVVEFELKNPLKRDIIFHPREGLLAFYFDVIRPDHVRAKRTALADEVFASNRDRVDLRGNGVVFASKSLHFSQDISKLFELPQGSYGVLMSVTVGLVVEDRKVFVTKTVWSNVAEIRVTAGDDKNAAPNSK